MHSEDGSQDVEAYRVESRQAARGGLRAVEIRIDPQRGKQYYSINSDQDSGLSLRQADRVTFRHLMRRSSPFSACYSGEEGRAGMHDTSLPPSHTRLMAVYVPGQSSTQSRFEIYILDS